MKDLDQEPSERWMDTSRRAMSLDNLTNTGPTGVRISDSRISVYRLSDVVWAFASLTQARILVDQGPIFRDDQLS